MTAKPGEPIDLDAKLQTPAATKFAATKRISARTPKPIQSDTSNFASIRGTAVPAVITGGTPVPRFTSLCIDPKPDE